MRTKQQYIERLSTMPPNLHMSGQKIDRTDEAQETTLNTIGLTLEYAARPEYQDLCTASPHLSGEKINRFTHIRQSREGLYKKQDMTRALCQIAGGCIQRCMGVDAANAICNASYEADRQNDGTTE